MGLHFFSPAHVMRLLEIVRGAATARDVLATALAFSRQLKKQAVVVGNSPDAFRAEIAREIARFKRAVAAAKIEVN